MARLSATIELSRHKSDCYYYDSALNGPEAHDGGLMISMAAHHTTGEWAVIPYLKEEEMRRSSMYFIYCVFFCGFAFSSLRYEVGFV